jgi:hypothetical protein
MCDGDDLYLSKENPSVDLHYSFGKVVEEIGSIMKSCRTPADGMRGKVNTHRWWAQQGRA